VCKHGWGGGRAVEVEQAFPDGSRHELADGSLVVKFNFALGRMNVHVHGSWINFQE